MLFTAVCACLAVSTVANAYITLKTFSTINPSYFVKSSAFKKLTKSSSSSKPPASAAGSSKRVAASTSPLMTVSSTTRLNTSMNRSGPLVKSTSSLVARARAVPPAAPMIANNRKYLKKNTLEPEGLIDRSDNNNEIQAPVETVLFENEDKTENFVQQIKHSLQRGNDDYLEKLSGRRAVNVEIARPKYVDIKSKGNGTNIDPDIKKPSTKSLYHVQSKHNLKSKQASTASWTPSVTSLHAKKRPSTPTAPPVSSTNPPTGLTTPSKYLAKRYKKTRKHKRKHDPRRLRSKYIKYESHLHDKKGEYKHESIYKAQRRHSPEKKRADTSNKHVTEAATSKEVEITIPADLVSDLTLRTILVPMVKRPPLYDTPIDSTKKKTPPVEVWYPKSSPTTRIDRTFDMKESEAKMKVHKEDPLSLTTPSAVERDFSKSNKKLERFMKYIKKNRGMLRQFMLEKKSGKHPKSKKVMKSGRTGRAGKGGKVGDKEAFFRGGMTAPVTRDLHPHQLDMSPAKGLRIEELRLKGRLCQRNVLVPEGPKYNSMGMIYMPAYQRKKGAPDYPATKPHRIIIPACCNCCKKSVLGCE